MPIKPHGCFVQPEPLAPLWRYMDLARFASLVTSRKLWLSSAEVLALDDPHEATLSPQTFSHREWACLEDVPEPLKAWINREFDYGPKMSPPRSTFQAFCMQREQIIAHTRAHRRTFFVSCWHAEQWESVAMWKIYGSPGPGVAIKSNVRRITQSLEGVASDLYLGRVRYYDQGTGDIDYSNAFNAVLTKRNSFSYESEVRIVHWDHGEISGGVDLESWDEGSRRFTRIDIPTAAPKPGVAIACDLDELIDQIIVSPNAPEWYAQTVSDLCGALGLGAKVQRSRLLDPPQLD